DPDASGILSPGVAQVPVNAAVSDSRPWWWDPWASPHGPASASMQLAGGAWISPDPPFLQTSAVQVDAAARWRVSSDGRVVTWTECDTGCPHRVYDSVTQQIGELLPGCWVAATDRRDDSTLICADGTQIVPPPGNHAIGLSTPAGQ